MTLKADDVQQNVRAVPTTDGVQLEFHCGGVDFEAVISTDGRLLEVACLKAEDQR